MRNLQKYIAILVLAVFISACNKTTDYSLSGDAPEKPEFSISSVEGDPNSFVVTDLSEGNFNRVWEFDGGEPASSTLRSDTVFYQRMGDYSVKLHVSSSSGGGSAFNEKTISVEQDVAGCQLKFLNEDCSAKCWTLSPEKESIILGPEPFSGNWFSSSESDITATQKDDKWCFHEDGTFTYENSGSSFSACAGYIEVEGYPIPEDLTYQYESGGGLEGFNRITLSDLWMGIEDSGITYDIAEITEDKMVVLAPLKPCDGSPSTGWFTLTFIPAE